MKTLNVPQVKHSDLKKIYDIALREKKAVLVVGKAGVGKTMSAYSFGKERSMKIIDAKLSQFDPVTIHGIPEKVEIPNRKVKKVTKWNPTEFLADAVEGNCVLLLDEYDKARGATAAASYEILLQRKYGEFTIPDDVLIVATANFVSEDFRSEGISIPQLDRVLRVELILNVNEWLEWAEKNDIDERIIRFIKENPNMLWREPDEESMTTTTPRGWESASRLIKGVSDLKMLNILVGGCVGADLGQAFTDFVKRISLGFEEIYANKNYESVKNMEIGEKKQFVSFLATRLEKEPEKVFEFITVYLNNTRDAEGVVYMLRELKAEVGEESFNELFRVTEWTGKKQFVKKLYDINQSQSQKEGEQ